MRQIPRRSRAWLSIPGALAQDERSNRCALPFIFPSPSSPRTQHMFARRSTVLMGPRWDPLPKSPIFACSQRPRADLVQPSGHGTRIGSIHKPVTLKLRPETAKRPNSADCEFHGPSVGRCHTSSSIRRTTSQESAVRLTHIYRHSPSRSFTLPRPLMTSILLVTDLTRAFRHLDDRASETNHKLV
jgi:hypothetical protein